MPRLRARSILHVGSRVVLSSKHAASRCGKFCSRRPVLFPRRQRATTPPSDMATKRPREGDAPDGGTCEPCEPATAPSVPSSNGRGLRKRPWEEEGFRCPYLDTINRTLLDFGVLLAPPHVFPPLPPPAEPPSRPLQISRRPARSPATTSTCTHASCVASTSKAAARTRKPTRTRSRCAAPRRILAAAATRASAQRAPPPRARRRGITSSRTYTTAASTACPMATR